MTGVRWLADDWFEYQGWRARFVPEAFCWRLTRLDGAGEPRWFAESGRAVTWIAAQTAVAS